MVYMGLIFFNIIITQFHFLSIDCTGMSDLLSSYRNTDYHSFVGTSCNVRHQFINLAK